MTKSDAKKGTVAVTGTRKKRNKITIPATVTKDGYTFKVTEIAAKHSKTIKTDDSGTRSKYQQDRNKELL